MTLKFFDYREKESLILSETLTTLKEMKAKDEVKVAQILPNEADGSLLCERYGLFRAHALNCLIVQGKKAEERIFASLLFPFGNKANINTALKKSLRGKKVSFAPLEEIIEKTKMKFGRIISIGLLKDWKVLVDETIFFTRQLL